MKRVWYCRGYTYLVGKSGLIVRQEERTMVRVQRELQERGGVDLTKLAELLSSAAIFHRG